jgi:hypothetical protein
MLWVCLAVAISVCWLWINFCRFPASSWNDIRLVPTFMAATGEPVYTPPGTGVITTWMYGPVPLWLWSPAVLGTDPVSALLIADGLNLLMTLAAIGLTCAYWPGKGVTRVQRGMTLAAVIALWPDHAFRFLQADNPAVALGLIANLLLFTDRLPTGNKRAWLAALCTALALGCKQNTLGLLAAQLLWLLWAFDWKTSLAQLVRTLICGGILTAIAAQQFGLHELWFGTVGIASTLPFVEDGWGRMRELSPILAIQWGLPLLAIGVVGKKLRAAQHPLSLPMLAWWTSLPLGILGLLSTGGSTNNLQGFHFVIIAVILSFIVWSARRLRQFYLPLMCIAVASVICARILTADRSPWRPVTQNVERAIELQATLPDQIWLPWNPLVTYYGDHQFYHAEDGLYVRFITGHPVSVSQARAHLPARFHAMAFPDARMQWGIAAKLAPADHRIRYFETWEIRQWTQLTP